MNSLIFVTGASGTGKTTAVKAIENKSLPNVVVCYYDSIGVPSTKEMVAKYGSVEAWQRQKMIDWVKKIKSEYPNKTIILDGQARQVFIEEACKLVGIENYQIITFVCEDKTRDQRLIERGHPELVNTDMSNWNKYLKGEAEKRGGMIIDTSTYQIGQAVEELESIVLMSPTQYTTGSKGVVDALNLVIPLLKKYNFRWVITGGFASHVYGVNRPITDIDIDIETSKDDQNFKSFMKDLKEYITQSLEHFVDQNYDNYNFEITVNGIVVDICPMAEMNVYDKKSRKYINFYESGFPDHEIKKWNGLKLVLLSKELIIKNKEILVWQRESDLKDIQELKALSKN